MLVEVIGNGRNRFVLADQDGNVLGLYTLPDQGIGFFCQLLQHGFGIRLFLVVGQECQFDVTFFVFPGCLLAYVTVSIKQLGTRIALFSFVAVVQNLTGCREQSVVEADDVGLTAPVGSQTAFSDPETRIISQPGQNLPVSVSPPVNALFDITDDQTSFFLCEAFL